MRECDPRAGDRRARRARDQELGGERERRDRGRPHLVLDHRRPGHRAGDRHVDVQVQVGDQQRVAAQAERV